MKRLLILTSLILTLTLLASCSSGGGYAPEPPGAPASSQAPAAAAPSMPGGAYTGGENHGYAEHDSTIPLPILMPADDRKMIYTVDLQLQTTEFVPGMRRLIDTIDNLGGYIAHANVEGRDMRRDYQERAATYTFKIPAERLAEFLVVVENNYNIVNLRQETQDATVRHEQNDALLDDLRDQERRLLDELEDEEDARLRMNIEHRLADVQASIRGAQASQSSIDNAVRYSTVNIQLYEVILPEQAEPEPTFGDRLSKTTQNSIEAFVRFAQGLLLIIIILLPVILGAGLMAALGYLLYRFVKKCIEKVKNYKTVKDNNESKDIDREQ